MLGTCLVLVVVSLSAHVPETIALGDGEGITLQVPDGWTARRDGSFVVLSSTRASAAIIVDVLPAAPTDEAALRTQLARARPTVAPAAFLRIGADTMAHSSTVTAGGDPMRVRTVARRLDPTHIVVLRGAARVEGVVASFDSEVDRFAASIVITRTRTIRPATTP